jgi:hypothetical protein
MPSSSLSRRPGAVTATASPQATAQLVGSLAELNAWLAGAANGEALVYHRGCLAIDRLVPGSRLPRRDAEELDRVAKAARAAADIGRVHLVQRRYGDGDYGYIIVARRRAPVFACRSELGEKAP